MGRNGRGRHRQVLCLTRYLASRRGKAERLRGPWRSPGQANPPAIPEAPFRGASFRGGVIGSPPRARSDGAGRQRGLGGRRRDGASVDTPEALRHTPAPVGFHRSYGQLDLLRAVAPRPPARSWKAGGVLASPAASSSPIEPVRPDQNRARRSRVCAQDGVVARADRRERFPLRGRARPTARTATRAERVRAPGPNETGEEGCPKSSFPIPSPSRA